MKDRSISPSDLDPGSRPPTPEEKMWAAFHRLWGKDQETPTYNKKQWIELETLILQALKERG